MILSRSPDASSASFTLRLTSLTDISELLLVLAIVPLPFDNKNWVTYKQILDYPEPKSGTLRRIRGSVGNGILTICGCPSIIYAFLPSLRA